MALEATLPSIAELIIEPFKKYVVGPVVRHITYPFRCGSKVRTLQDEVEKLNNKRLRLQQSVDAATRNGEEIFPDVTKWLTTAGEDIEDAEQLIQGKAEALNKCFLGLCPNLKTRYQLSKKAHKKSSAVCKKLQDAQAVPDPISFRPPPHQIVEPSVYSSEALPSRVLILDQIMDALKDPKLSMIGVYGMGGVGKSTLAKEVKGRALQEKMLFETVVKVDVSQTINLRRIQGEIADSLGLRFDAEEVPGRASQLHKRLEKAKVLIILDDVWHKLDLNAVGVPSGDVSEGCKILVTSRRKEVLCNEMRTQKEFLLEVLKEEETWRLFEMSVSNITDPELYHISTEIAKKCAGLPLLILKVAADLRGKEPYAWSDMLNRLSSSENTEIYEKVHKVIESSYENLLDEQAKSVFLLCALFGDSNIEIHKLLMYSVGLGLFKRIDSVEGARNRVLTSIDKLKDECLLLEGDRVGFVKIHDVIREIALVIVSRVQRVFVGAGKVTSANFQNKGCTRISLPYCDISEFPGILECPEAEVFSLFSNFRDDVNIPSSLFQEGVPKLKVVDFTGVRFVSELPSSLGCLKGLQTLCLQRCEFDNVGIVAELKQLEVLSFAGSDIQELPGEIKGLTRLKLLDLRDCYLGTFPANVLSELSRLEELYMLRSFSGWGIKGNANLVELKNLCHMTTLEIQVKHGKFLPEDWFFNGVQNCRISVGRWHWYENETSRRILKLELETSDGLMNRIKEFVRGIEVLELRNVKGVGSLLYDYGSFEKLQFLKILECDTLESLLSHSFPKFFPQLQELLLHECGNMEAIVGEGCGVEEIEFPQLTSLELSNLSNLTGLCRTSGTVSFPSLTRLEIHECNGLKYVFRNSMLKSLKQLKKLEIRRCESLEEIIMSEEIEEQNSDKIEFPKLDCIKLEYLRKLKRFSSGCPVDFPSLRVLEIKRCQATEKNWISNFLNRNNTNEGADECLFNGMVTFSNLEELRIDRLDHSKYVFHASFNLPQLRKLQIEECGAEVIFANAKNETIEIELPRLTHLDVSDCVNLISISANVSKLFPNLEILELDHHSLKAIQRDGLPHDFSFNLKKLALRNLSLERKNLNWLFPSVDDEREMGDHQKKYHPTLQLLELHNVSNLKHILMEDSLLNPVLRHLQTLKVCECDDLMNVAPPSASFQSLTELEVARCKKMTSLLTASTAKTMVQLVRLDVSGCSMMEEIVAKDGGACLTEQDMIIFRNLQRLDLVELDRLNSFCSANYNFNFPVLKQVTINCPRMRIFCRGIPSTPILHSIEINNYRIQPLRDVNAAVWSHLREWVGELILPNELKLFTKLKKLILGDCKWAEVVFDLEGLSVEDAHVRLLPLLEELELINLPMLTQLCNRAPRGILDFHNLIELKIDNCSRLEYALTSSMSSSLFKLESIRVENCEMMETIIMEDDAPIYSERGGLKYCPSLQMLTIRNCPSIKAFFSRRTMYDPCGECSSAEQVFDLEEIKHFKMEQMNELRLIDLPSLRNVWSKHPRKILSFENLSVLKVKNCGNLTCIFNLSIALSLPKLRHLVVTNCSLVEYIIAKGEDETMQQYQTILPSLKEMKLKYLTKLLSFYSTNGLMECPALKYVEVIECPNMELSSSTFSRLQDSCSIPIEEREEKIGAQYGDSGVPLLGNMIVIPLLKELKVEWNVLADFLNNIQLLSRLRFIDLTGFNDEYALVPSNVLQNFPNLEKLTLSDSSVEEMNLHELSTSKDKISDSIGFPIKMGLSNLPKLKHLVRDESQLVPLFQILVELEVCECGTLKILVPPSVSFRTLTDLEVSKCDGMEHLISAPTARSLVQLRRLKVRDCKTMQEIVAVASGEVEYEICFSQLENLELVGLPGLTSFCSGNYVFRFPSLEEVVVKECPKMENFAEKVEVTPKLKKVETGRQWCKWEWEGSLSNTVHSLFMQGRLNKKMLQNVR